MERFQWPDPRTMRALVLRSVGLWAGTRLIYMMVAAYGNMPIGFARAGVPLFALAVGGVAIVDLRALRDDVFLANLGVGARHVFAIACCMAFACEVIVAIVALLIRA